jgi:ferrous iron transport protein B
MKGFVRTQEKGFLLLELPTYKMPRWENVLLLVWEKARVFLWEAGRIVFAISIILWVGASYGPGDAQEKAVAALSAETLSATEYEKAVATEKLSNSYIGHLGQALEPVIKPLGYDWKIGIALVASFAAREVFVGTLATLYSVGEEEEGPLLERMRQATWPDGSPIYTLATGLSLMVFYAFAMQCMSTLAVVVRETKSWKWAAWQAAYMTALAYVAAWAVFQVLS